MARTLLWRPRTGTSWLQGSNWSQNGVAQSEPPDDTDAVSFDANSGDVTIPAGNVARCNSLTTPSDYTAFITIGGGSVLAIANGGTIASTRFRADGPNAVMWLRGGTLDISTGNFGLASGSAFSLNITGGGILNFNQNCNCSTHILNGVVPDNIPCNQVQVGGRIQAGRVNFLADVAFLNNARLAQEAGGVITVNANKSISGGRISIADGKLVALSGSSLTLATGVAMTIGRNAIFEAAKTGGTTTVTGNIEVTLGVIDMMANDAAALPAAGVRSLAVVGNVTISGSELRSYVQGAAITGANSMSVSGTADISTNNTIRLSTNSTARDGEHAHVIIVAGVLTGTFTFYADVIKPLVGGTQDWVETYTATTYSLTGTVVPA